MELNAFKKTVFKVIENPKSVNAFLDFSFNASSMGFTIFFILFLKLIDPEFVSNFYSLQAVLTPLIIFSNFNSREWYVKHVSFNWAQLSLQIVSSIALVLFILSDEYSLQLLWFFGLKKLDVIQEIGCLNEIKHQGFARRITYMVRTMLHVVVLIILYNNPILLMLFSLIIEVIHFYFIFNLIDFSWNLNWIISGGILTANSWINSLVINTPKVEFFAKFSDAEIVQFGDYFLIGTIVIFLINSFSMRIVFRNRLPKLFKSPVYK